MTDLTSAVQKPGYTGIAPTYTALTGTDKFAAVPNGRYMIHYKNGATSMAAGTLTVTNVADAAAPPAGSTPAAGWADIVTVPNFMAANTELVVWIPNATPYRDNLGFVNLSKTGSPVFTTVTAAIFGPF